VTAALLAVGFAALLWPGESRVDARVRRLRADQRLASVVPPTGSLRRQHRQRRLAALATRTISASGGSRGALVAGLVAAGALLTAQGPVAAGEFGTCVFLILWASFSVGRHTLDWRRRAARQAEVSLGVTLLASELEAGAAPAQAIRAAGAIGAELEGEATAARAVTWSAREGDPMARVAAAWQVSARTGAPIVALLAGVRADLADRGDTDRAVATAVAGAQASAAVLALLPILGILLGSAIGGDPLAVLFATAAGRVLLCIGVALNAAGVMWTVTLIARARR
jgi:tight adherence protein B